MTTVASNAGLTPGHGSFQALALGGVSDRQPRPGIEPPAGVAKGPAGGSLSGTLVADAGVISGPTTLLTIAAGMILTAAFAQWWINENPQVIADAADQIGEKWHAAADAARRLGVEVAVPAKAAIEREITSLFRGIKDGSLSNARAGRALVESLWSPAPAVQPSAQATVAPRSLPLRTAQPLAPRTDATPSRQNDDLQAQMRLLDRSHWVSMARLRIDSATALLNSATGQTKPISESLSAFYWKASTGAAGRTSGDVQGAVRGVQAHKDHLDQLAALSNDSVAGVQTAATTLARLGDAGNSATAQRWADALRARRDDVKQLANGLGGWLRQAYAYAQDGKNPLPSLATIASGGALDIDRAGVRAAQDAARRALSNGAAPLQGGSNAGSAAPPSGTVPPGGVAASGSPQPPGGPGPDDLARRVVKGAVFGALGKVVAYAANHRDKSLQEMLSDPGIYLAATQGAVEGAALGVAWTVQGARMTQQQLQEAVRNDFVFSGTISAVIDAGLQIASGVRDGRNVGDAISQYVRSGKVFDSLAAGLSTSVDAAALGIGPGALIKIPALTGIAEQTVFKAGVGTASPTVRYFAPVPNYWKNMLGQGALRSAIGSAVDLSNQVTANGGDTSKINGERVFWSGVGSSLYPFVTQGLQRLSIPLARHPKFGPQVAELKSEMVIDTSTARVFSRNIVNTKLTDTKQPLAAYGGRALIYGVLISSLKKHAQENQGLNEATLQQSMKKAEDILRDPKQLEQQARDPSFRDTLRRMESLSLIEKATLLGRYVPSEQASKQLDEMQTKGADIKQRLSRQPQPQQPTTPQEWDDPARVQRFHRELDLMIDSAYRHWAAQGKPGEVPSDEGRVSP